MKKIPMHRSARFGKIGGVCAGLAETTNVPSLYIRAAFFILFFYGSLAFWLYLILWIILPVLEVDNYAVHEKEIFRSRRDKLLGGVCSGLAKATHVDPTIVRLVFLGFTLFGGSGFLIYLVLWLSLPCET
ncbi:MAG: PspC domain-containing protein [Candidatus Cloacimonetes bacterium]|nr:PspC domain-containing protein [Candidatus Cloacimonadota bacterium]